MGKRLLNEDKHPSKFTVVKKVIEERTDGTPSRLIVSGIFQKEGVKNQNNRKYPSEVWDINLSEDSSFMRRLQAKAVAGELEHPESGETHLQRVSHVIRKVWREPLEEGNEYGVTAGKYIFGEAVILKTPNGAILEELFQVGFPVGISSRGLGDVVLEGDTEIVQENYELETWDFVYNPSVIEALPKVHGESTLENVQSQGASTTFNKLTEKIQSNEVEHTILVNLLETACAVELEIQKKKKVPTSLRDLRESLSNSIKSIEEGEVKIKRERGAQVIEVLVKRYVTTKRQLIKALAENMHSIPVERYRVAVQLAASIVDKYKGLYKDYNEAVQLLEVTEQERCKFEKKYSKAVEIIEGFTKKLSNRRR